MAAKKYTLVYYNFRGRAEGIRLLLAAAGVEYEDKRFKPEEWPKEKLEAPQGTVPYLVIDGQKMSQSLAISRYLAREHGLYGKDNMDAFYIDEIVDTVADLVNIGARALGEKDETLKAKLNAEFKDVATPRIMNLLNNAVEQRGKDGFAVGSSLTYADISLFAVIETFSLGENNGLEKYPKLKANEEKTRSNPNIAKWLKDRPVTSF